MLAFLLVLGPSVSAGAAQFAYVANSWSGTLSVIDIATNTVAATVPVGPFPMGVAVSPEGTRIYVTNETADGTVTVVDGARRTAVASIRVGQWPAGVAVKLPGNKVYAVNRDDGTVSVIDTATRTVTATVVVGKSPQGIAVHPAGTPAYVANQKNDTVSVINTNTDTVRATVGVGHNPTYVAVNPAGTRVYVANDSYGLVSVIDTATNVVTANVRVGNYPAGIAIDPSGRRAYVANRGPNTVSVIDTVGSTVVATIPVGTNPSAVAVEPSGRRVYVTNQSGASVSVIDTAAGNVVTATIPVGQGPVGMGEFIMPALVPPVFGKAARACQAELANGGRKFALANGSRHASCRSRLLKYAVEGKDTALAAATCGQALDIADPRSALARLRSSSKQKIVKRCSTLTPAALHGPCNRAARTFEETADCVLDQHRARVAEMITMQYGPDAVPSLTKPGRTCQETIASNARRLAKFVHQGLATCLNRILKDAAADKGTAAAAASCARVLDPENPVSKLVRTRAKAEAKIAKRCATLQAASLATSCGEAAATSGELAACVLDEHVAGAAKMIAAEYNGACPMLTSIGLGVAFPAACTGP